MFDIGWSELLVIGVVALIAIGPKELPGVLRAAGHWMGKVRRMASEFQDQFREAMREAEVADLKKQFDDASAKATAAFTNPLETAHKEVEAALGSEPKSESLTPDKPVDTFTTTETGAIEPSASAPAPEAASATVSETAAPEPAVADAPAGLQQDPVKQSGSGVA